MSMARRFHGEPVNRLIVSVPVATVAEIDTVLGRQFAPRHAARGNRSEFVRLAILEKLQRDQSKVEKSAAGSKQERNSGPDA